MIRRTLVVVLLLAGIGCGKGDGYDPGTVSITCEKSKLVKFDCSYQPYMCQEFLTLGCRYAEVPAAEPTGAVGPRGPK